ncbi:Uncharacterised protein [Mycobacterium tuberculosis]|uniref:Uncharacterized protein n=1 Tax=Mycobacterium tuberculosis TaxID=1773 RepID=A0A655IPL9_MYCTX|nr:Uncharacterised protein [Mycobacterium tuberculosis]COW08161.1 Uncharacterised protein [Mycobacterium tuberculosis]CPA89831.1 Uncharacterised protein [Mycobacterium tuberculosis]
MDIGRHRFRRHCFRNKGLRNESLRNHSLRNNEIGTDFGKVGLRHNGCRRGVHRIGVFLLDPDVAGAGQQVAAVALLTRKMLGITDSRPGAARPADPRCGPGVRRHRFRRELVAETEML